MTSAPATIGPGDLARRLAALRVNVEALRGRSGALASLDYPGGSRPTGIIACVGEGETGYGEHVGFSAAAQQAFAARVPTLLPCPWSGKVAAAMAQIDAAAVGPHDRAAIEAALIDLALRQARLRLADLGGLAQAPLRWVASFGADPDPAARLRTLRAAGAGTAFKIDVDPAWSEAQLAQLAAPDVQDAIVILDFKEGGTAALAARLAHICPGAIFEDPPASVAHPRIARDRPLLTRDDVARAALQGEAVNLKAPRMGGPLAVLDALALAQHHGVLAYVGGMFEVGPGRLQARQLAALFCPEGPNDLGPIAGGVGPALSAPVGSRSVVRLDGPGFGAFDRQLARQQGVDPLFE